MSRALWVWLGITLVFIITNAAILLFQGKRFYASALYAGPHSSTGLNLASVALVWLFLGAALLLLSAPAFRMRYGFPTACGFVVALLYINICRERPHVGDMSVYLDAATALASGAHLPHAYLYPPLLATMLEPLVRFGPMVMAGVFWVANMLALVAFFGLLVAALERYGFSRRFAAIVTLLFMVVNVPIMRTLFYVQVNLYVTDLILLTLLAYPRIPVLSALALAVAVHIKTSPAVVALPFLVAKDPKWIAWFAVFLLAVAGITLATRGTQPFRDYLVNVSGIYNTIGVNFRENSVDSLVRSAAMLTGIALKKATPVIAVLKGGPAPPHRGDGRSLPQAENIPKGWAGTRACECNPGAATIHADRIAAHSGAPSGFCGLALPGHDPET
jgi:Glycosyltransferase family 87